MISLLQGLSACNARVCGPGTTEDDVVFTVEKVRYSCKLELVKTNASCVSL